jgi:hypothetical protein
MESFLAWSFVLMDIMVIVLIISAINVMTLVQFALQLEIAHVLLAESTPPIFIFNMEPQYAMTHVLKANTLSIQY